MDTALRPSYNVLSVAELENSPWMLISDGKGVITTWNVGPDMDMDEPEHVLEAHIGSVHQILALRSNRLPEVVEEVEWPPELIPGVPRKMVAIASPLKDDATSVSTAASQGQAGQDKAAEPQLPRADSGSAAGSDQGSLVSGEVEQRRGVGALLRRMCSCCCKAPPVQKTRRPKRFRRVTQRHWMIASAGEDGFVRVWRYRPLDEKTLQRNPDLDPLEVDFITEWCSKSQISVTRMMELHDGHLALALQNSPDIRILDPVNSQIKSVLFGHTGQVLSMAACADGRLVTGGADGSVRLWAKRTWGQSGEDTGTRTLGGAIPAVEDMRQDPPLPGQVAEEAAAPPAAAVGWAEPDQEPANAGVSNMAFYAHMQQAEKGESINLALRVYVVCAESLPKGGAADPYVRCCVMEGEQHVPATGTTMRTFSKAEPIWDQRCCLPLRRSLVEGEWQLSECSHVDFEVFLEPRSRSSSEILLGHWTAQLHEVVAEIERDASLARQPQPRKLYAPPGEGTYQELKASVLHVGFEQLTPESLDCMIGFAEGLPENLNGTMYVRVHIRQALPGRTRRLPPPIYREKTRVVRRSVNPFFDDVLELEVPIHLTDRRLVYGPELCVQLEVYDASMRAAEEDLMATLTLPLAAALQADGQDPRPYNLTLGSSATSSRRRRDGARSSLVGLRKAADSGADILDETLAELAPLSRLHVGFQAILPCPVQMRCTVEYAHGVPAMVPVSPSAAPVNRGTFLPMVRMSFVEGNPLPAHATAVRTKTWRQKLKPTDRSASPVWDEKCFLMLPSWIWEVSVSKTPPHPQRLSVREGWEHHRDDPSEAVVCVDVYDRDVLGGDRFLGRAIVPFTHAYSAARAGTGHQPRPVNLTCLPDSFLWLGFEMGSEDDQLVVIVATAQDLPVDSASGQAAMNCIVRVTELGAFYAPTDKADLTCIARAQTPPGQGHPRDPVWQHEELLELPGGEVDSVVAVRPNWYILFEVVDSDPRAVDTPPLAVAAAPLADVLSQSYEAQAPEKASQVLQKRIKDVRAPILPAKSRIAAVPGEESSTIVPIIRELPLVIRKATLESQDQPSAPSRTPIRDRLRQGTQKTLTRMLTRNKVNVDSLPDSPASALSLDDGVDEDDRVLIVRFEVLSRWRGTGGGAKCPPTRPMSGPSPVMSLVALISSVVAGHENGNVFVWDVTGSSAVPLHQFQAHKVPISCMAHLPMLDCIATTAMPTTRKEAVSESLLRLWSCSAFELRQTLPLHGAGSRCLTTVRPEGKGGAFVLALGKDSRQSSLLQFFKLDTS